MAIPLSAEAIAALIATAIGILTFFVGLNEYRRQGAQKRVDLFIEMRRRLKENETFKKISDLLDDENPELQEIPFKDKRDYLGLFEEVALMLNSGLIRKQVAHYMFGYYAIRCWESEYFWMNVNRESVYWKVFRRFYEQMKQIETSFQYNDKEFRL